MTTKEEQHSGSERTLRFWANDRGIRTYSSSWRDGCTFVKLSASGKLLERGADALAQAAQKPPLPHWSQVTDSVCPEFPVLVAHKELFLGKRPDWSVRKKNRRIQRGNKHLAPNPQAQDHPLVRNALPIGTGTAQTRPPGRAGAVLGEDRRATKLRRGRENRLSAGTRSAENPVAHTLASPCAKATD